MNALIRIVAGVLLVFTASVIAGEPYHHTPCTGSAEFERLKGLAGNWQGTATMEGKEQTIQVAYRVTSAGSAIVETHFPGSPQETVSVCHDEGGRPGMTHSCALKNRPGPVMDSNDKETIEQKWVMYQDGKAADSTTFRLQRAEQL